MTLDLVRTTAEILMALAAVALVARVAWSRSGLDRILTLDAAALTLVGYLLLQGDRTGGHFYLDAALTLALLSFVATVALALHTGGTEDEGDD